MAHVPLRYMICYYFRWLLVVVSALVLCACESSPREFRHQVQNHIKAKMTDVQISSDYTMGYLTSDDLLNPTFQKEQSSLSKRSNLGALRFVHHNTASKGVGTLVTFYRQKRQIMAETRLFEDKKYKYFFAVGIDRHERMPAMAFRVEF